MNSLACGAHGRSIQALGRGVAPVSGDAVACSHLGVSSDGACPASGVPSGPSAHLGLASARLGASPAAAVSTATCQALVSRVATLAWGAAQQGLRSPPRASTGGRSFASSSACCSRSPREGALCQGAAAGGTSLTARGGVWRRRLPLHWLTFAGSRAREGETWFLPPAAARSAAAGEARALRVSARGPLTGPPLAPSASLRVFARLPLLAR